MPRRQNHKQGACHLLCLSIIPAWIFYLSFLSFCVAAEFPFPESSQRSPRIIGGHEAEAGAWPWVAALIHSDVQSLYYGHFCGGALIDATWVITAAHCTYDFATPLVPADIDAVLGVHDLADDVGQRIRVKTIIRHPKYIPNKNAYDIALLELEHPSTQEPVILFAGGSGGDLPQSLVGEPATVIGWGSTSGNYGYPQKLQQVTIPIVDHALCVAVYSPGTINESMLCAGYPEGGKDSCAGDSGGPLMVFRDGEWVEVGIVSWGEGCAQPDLFGVYSRISAFVDFLKENVPAAHFTPSFRFQLSPPKINFLVDMDLDYQSQEIVLLNQGNMDISVDQVAITNSLDPPFSLISDTCSNRVLTFSDFCTITVGLTADSTQYIEDSFEISLSDPELYSFNVSVSFGSNPWKFFLPAILHVNSASKRSKVNQ